MSIWYAIRVLPARPPRNASRNAWPRTLSPLPSMLMLLRYEPDRVPVRQYEEWDAEWPGLGPAGGALLVARARGHRVRSGGGRRVRSCGRVSGVAARAFGVAERFPDPGTGAGASGLLRHGDRPAGHAGPLRARRGHAGAGRGPGRPGGGLRRVVRGLVPPGGRPRLGGARVGQRLPAGRPGRAAVDAAGERPEPDGGAA